MAGTTALILELVALLAGAPVSVDGQTSPQSQPPPCPAPASPECRPLPSETTETNRGPIIPFLEGTDVFWTVVQADSENNFPFESSRTFPYRLEGDIFPHLVVYQNFTDVVDVTEQSKRRLENLKEIAWSVTGTPAVRIRMLPTTSAPVRTPSFMPRGNVQILWARGLKDKALRALDEARSQNPQLSARLDAARTQSPERAEQFRVQAALANLSQVSLWEAHLIVGHHSNGQDGCLSTEQQRDPPMDGPCVPAGVAPTRATINRIDGSFSTNYIRTGVNYSWNRLKPADPARERECCDPEEVEAVEERRIRAELEYHPRAWVDDDMVELYGRVRFNVNGAWAFIGPRFCQRRTEASAGLVWNPGVVDTVPEVSFMGQMSCFPTRNGGWGFFVRYYQGQDYYNVGFLDDIRRLHVGLTFNQAGFFRFRRPRTPGNGDGQPSR